MTRYSANTRRPALLAVAMAIIVSLGGCAYYNIFFNAKRAFDQAESNRRSRQASESGTSAGTISRPVSVTSMSSSSQSFTIIGANGMRVPAQGDQLYEVAIEKCAKVLQYHPQSRYVDDALLLMAKSYFRLEDYPRALRKTEELATSFPESELREEAGYWRGMTLWKLGEKEQARETLTEIAGRDSRFRGNAAYALADMEREEGRLDEAIENYRQALRTAQDPIFRDEARRALGDCLITAGRPAEAAEVYRGLLENVWTNRERFEILSSVADAQKAAGDYDAALETLMPLLDDEAFYELRPKVLLRVAEVRALRGDVSDAVLLYRDVIRQGEETREAGARTVITRNEEAREAYYRLALLHESHFRNLDRAREFFEIATESRTIGGFGDDARAKKAALDKWAELRTALADTSDSTDVALDRTTFALADLFYFRMNSSDSAAYYYDAVVDSFPESPLRPRALYASGWLRWFEQGDSTAADSIWQPIVADTTGAPELAPLKEQIALVHGPAPDDPAMRPFREAESLWVAALMDLPAAVPDTLDSAAVAPWWDEWRSGHRVRAGEYAPLLDSLVSRYPRSPYAVRAAYILGWEADNVERDTVQALEWYRLAGADTTIAPDVAQRARGTFGLREAAYFAAHPELVPVEEPDSLAVSDSLALSDSLLVAADSLTIDTTLAADSTLTGLAADSTGREIVGQTQAPGDSLGVRSDSTNVERAAAQNDSSGGGSPRGRRPSPRGTAVPDSVLQERMRRFRPQVE